MLWRKHTGGNRELKNDFYVPWGFPEEPALLSEGRAQGQQEYRAHLMETEHPWLKQPGNWGCPSSRERRTGLEGAPASGWENIRAWFVRQRSRDDAQDGKTGTAWFVRQRSRDDAQGSRTPLRNSPFWDPCSSCREKTPACRWKSHS